MKIKSKIVPIEILAVGELYQYAKQITSFFNTTSLPYNLSFTKNVIDTNKYILKEYPYNNKPTAELILFDSQILFCDKSLVLNEINNSYDYNYSIILYLNITEKGIEIHSMPRNRAISSSNENLNISGIMEKVLTIKKFTGSITNKSKD